MSGSRWALGACGARGSIVVAGMLLGASPGAASAAPADTHLTASTASGQIVVARGDGGGRRVFGHGYASFVSPNGSQIAVRDFDSTSVGPTNETLKLFASAGGVPLHVLAVDCLEVYWSPDSTKLACVDHDVSDDSGQLLVIDAASAAATTVASGFIGSQVSFSPNSAKLAYVRNPDRSAPKGGALKVVDLATGASTTLRQRAAYPVWGPRRIAFSTVKPGAYGRTVNVAVVKPNGSGFRRLTRFRPRFLQSGLSPVAWSANGKRLLASLGGEDVFEAFAVNPKRGGARRILPRVTPGALSRNGRFVIGGDNTEASYDDARSNIVRVPWTGGKPRVLIRHAGSPSFNG